MKKLIIKQCKECCYFDNHYYSYNEKCERLNRVIKEGHSPNKLDYSTYYPIPEDCPLEEA